MILSFSRPEFKQKILDGVKVHTIRKDIANRWKVGGKIHFWMGNPRNSKSNPNVHQFGEGVVSDVIPVRIRPNIDEIRFSFTGGKTWTENKHIPFLDAVAVNDGFANWEEMKEWFKEDFDGKVIIWGNLDILTRTSKSKKPLK